MEDFIRNEREVDYVTSNAIKRNENGVFSADDACVLARKSKSRMSGAFAKGAARRISSLMMTKKSGNQAA